MAKTFVLKHQGVTGDDAASVIRSTSGEYCFFSPNNPPGGSLEGSFKNRRGEVFGHLWRTDTQNNKTRLVEVPDGAEELVDAVELLVAVGAIGEEV